ncbi:MAG: hypothetical protein AAGE52_23520 [Myxococcota bacterium]
MAVSVMAVSVMPVPSVMPVISVISDDIEADMVADAGGTHRR